MIIRILIILVVAFYVGTEAMAQKKGAARGKPAAAAGGFQRSLTIGTSFLKKRDFSKALEFADKAIAQKADDPRGYALAIQAYAGLEDFETALSTGERAKAACKPELLASIENLLSEIATDKLRHDRIRTAEKYAAEGNAKMAASAYEEAWNGDPANEDLGLKAASIYNDQVKDFDRSTTILSKLLLRTKDATISSQAKELLQVAENNRAEKAESDKRAAEERAAKEAEERERQRQLQKDREKESERKQVEEQIKELERERSSLESEVSSEESFAEQQDGFADDWERQANQYDSQPPLGPTFAVIARNKAKSSRSKANSHRSNAKDAQRKITAIDRQIASLERKLY